MYTALALVVLAGLLGPLLASGRRFRVPVLTGELIGGIILGRTGLNVIDPTTQPFPIFSSLGFALLMLESGTEIDNAWHRDCWPQPNWAYLRLPRRSAWLPGRSVPHSPPRWSPADCSR